MSINISFTIERSLTANGQVYIWQNLGATDPLAGIPLSSLAGLNLYQVGSSSPNNQIVSVVATGSNNTYIVTVTPTSLLAISFDGEGITVIIQNVPVPVPVSNICFPAGTPVQTDQGIILIDLIDPAKHTINGNSILHITKTVTLDKYLIYFPMNSIERNVPGKATIMSKEHKIEFKGQLVPAERFLKYSREIKKVKYSGELLYNVLIKDHSRMNINGLKCETLHPDNIIAKLYTNGYSDEERCNIIFQLNNSLEKRDLLQYKTVVKRLTQ